MYGILCKKDGDPAITIPIVKDEDDGCMATWGSLKEAKAFAMDHILCQISEVFFIDLDDGQIDF